MRRPAHRIDLFKELPQGSIGAEVGVWRGYFSSDILSLPNINRLYSIDTWGPYLDEDQVANESEARANLRPYEYRSVVIKKPSTEVTGLPLLDFVFIDADHTYEGCYADLRHWSKALKPSGVLMGHDYTNSAEAKAMNFGVVDAVEDFCERYGWEIEALTDEPWASYRLVRSDWRGAEL